MVVLGLNIEEADRTLVRLLFLPERESIVERASHEERQDQPEELVCACGLKLPNLRQSFGGAVNSDGGKTTRIASPAATFTISLIYPSSNLILSYVAFGRVPRESLIPSAIDAAKRQNVPASLAA